MALGHPNLRWFRLRHRSWHRYLHPCAPLVAALGLGVAASHCSTPSSDAPSSKPAPPGSTAPPFEVHFDARIRRVSVAIGVPVNAETKAVVRVRKGTLKLDGLETLNCGELATGTAALDLRTPVAGDGADGVLTYDGPVVPESYKDQYYDDDSNEIGPDATPEQLAAIAAGTDPIVEGCLWQGDQVVGKVQLSLFRAWDKATPDLVKKAMAYERGEALGVAPTIQSVTTYGELCEAELGEIPFFPKREDGTRATYDCTKDPRSVTLPITVMNGQGVEEPQAVEPPKCDRPDWLRGSCAPFTRVQRDINKEGTRWVLLCRKPEPGQGKDGTHFNDIALIGHNPKTGKACFFQNGLYGKTDGAHIASPADPQRAEATWSAFSAAKCNACHDDDAFNHSPWVDQAKYPDGRFVVPRMGDDPDYALGVLAKYRLVGMRTKQWFMRPALEPTAESAPCTGCHRFGLGNAVTGEQTSASWVERAFGTDTDFNESRVTPAFLVAKRQEWMPELHGGQTLSKEQWDAYDRAVKSLVKCGLEDSSCATKPFDSSF